MSIDLDSTEGRKQYLSDKLDDLLDGINESYGSVLMEELLNRLEFAIRDFNDEMKTLCDKLIKKQEERQHLLEMLTSKELISSKLLSGADSLAGDNADSEITHSVTPNIIKKLPSEESVEDLPAWEKKLAKLRKKLK